MSHPPPPEGEPSEPGQPEQGGPEVGEPATGRPTADQPAPDQPRPGHEGYGHPGYGPPGYGPPGQPHGAGQPPYGTGQPYGSGQHPPYGYDPTRGPHGYDPSQPPYGYGGQQPYGYDPQQPAYGYGQPPLQQQPYYAGAMKPEHPGAVPSLVIGVIALSGVIPIFLGLPLLLGPWAWVKGKRTVDEIEASGGALGGRGQAMCGYVFGIVATVLLGLGILAIVVLAVVGLAVSTSPG